MFFAILEPDMNHSPWIAQLKRTRPADTLSGPLGADIVVVGGGIAGVTTAYMILARTDLSVALLEAGKVAHGATGHNAGQITSYFEKSFAELVAQFGFEKAVHAQKVVEEDARTFLDEIITHADIRTPHSQFIGYDGLSTREQLIVSLTDSELKARGGLRVRPILIAREWEGVGEIPAHLMHYAEVTSQENILALLETVDTQYIAALPFLSGCMNSALFSEEIAGYLIATYPDRFTLKEHSPVERVVLEQDRVVLESKGFQILCSNVVLCTNGFESIKIVNTVGKDVDTAFHHTVQGKVGYMGAYKEDRTKGPFASIYTHEHADDDRNPYFYTTRRPYEDEHTNAFNLVCIGGPEIALPDRAIYDPYHEYPLVISDEIDTFSAQNYQRHPPQMDYYWHGLMGYTTSGVRLIGTEPHHSRLQYNLGCNGVGILTSIYGADRIARILRGDTLERTIFDPAQS